MDPLLLGQLATQLSSRGWVEPVPDLMEEVPGIEPATFWLVFRHTNHLANEIYMETSIGKENMLSKIKFTIVIILKTIKTFTNFSQ